MPRSDDDPGAHPKFIESDIACLSCGYNIRGLNPDSRCPECGGSVSDAVHILASIDSFEAWRSLQTLCGFCGQLCLMIALAILPAWGVILIATLPIVGGLGGIGLYAACLSFRAKTRRFAPAGWSRHARWMHACAVLVAGLMVAALESGARGTGAVFVPLPVAAFLCVVAALLDVEDRTSRLQSALGDPPSLLARRIALTVTWCAALTLGAASAILVFRVSATGTPFVVAMFMSSVALLALGYRILSLTATIDRCCPT